MKISMNQDVNSKKSHYIGESIVASTAGSVASVASLPAGLAVMKGMQKIGNLPADKVEILHKAAEQAIKDTGLAAKGVAIEYIKEPATKQGIKSLMMGPLAQISEGYNAAFTSKPIKSLFGKVIHNGNTILMPEKGISFAAFHEIGHAMNYNFSKIGKALQHMRLPGMIAASAIALYGAFSSKSKPEEGKELTKGQKVNNFIRNNAGKLSFAAMLPMLAEEAMATIKGNKLAGKLLSPDMLKVVKKGNAVAYLSYIATAAGLGLASWAAVKVKDALVAKKEAKQAA